MSENGLPDPGVEEYEAQVELACDIADLIGLVRGHQPRIASEVPVLLPCHQAAS